MGLLEKRQQTAFSMAVLLFMISTNSTTGGALLVAPS
jgi:hypothetical protein